MNLESTLSNGDDLVKSPDTSTIPDTDLTDTTPIASGDTDDGKTTVIVVQAPAAESSEEKTDDATAVDGEEVSATGAQLTTAIEPHTEDSTRLETVFHRVCCGITCHTP